MLETESVDVRRMSYTIIFEAVMLVQDSEAISVSLELADTKVSASGNGIEKLIFEKS